MTLVSPSITDFLCQTPPFDLLSKAALEKLSKQSQQLRYRMGQAVILGDQLPAQIAIVYDGQVRILGVSLQSKQPETLQRLGEGAVLGWQSILRGVPCEIAIASTEVTCLMVPVAEFQALLRSEIRFAAAFHEHCGLSELYDLLGQEVQQQAIANVHLLTLVQDLLPEAVALSLPAGKVKLDQLDGSKIWFVSSGKSNYPIGSRLLASDAPLVIESRIARLIGIPKPEVGTDALLGDGALNDTALSDTALSVSAAELAIATNSDVPYAPDRPASLEPDDAMLKRGHYPIVRAKGEVETALAAFQMLSQLWKMPFRRDVLRRALVNQKQRTGGISLQFCGAIGELMGLTAQLAKVPASAISQLQTPVMLRWQDHFVLVYHISNRLVILGSPDRGLMRLKPESFIDLWGEEGEVLLLQPTKDTPQQKFGLKWFIPVIVRYRRVLIEVLVASFFVQLLSLANPLITQIIIDKVIIQNGSEALNVLGTLLVMLALAESVVTAIRTNLFVETTNRIDMKLGSEVIDHLFRLPLSYFEKRPVGELTTRINELENIRQFLTGTALTVVLDAVFSVIYVVVMLCYSPLMTVVALGTVPLFAILTLTCAPILRQQARHKAERNAQQQSYLVEVISGIQTVKAQNIELRSRWHWQDDYARYVNAGFKTVMTSTTSGAISAFLNRLSSLLLLWVGAYLVLKGQLTLGQLIAFRIIAGYTTSPLLRLIQLWQNFQETSLSLERLSDILDTPQETSEADRANIPMPQIQGSVTYENVTFRFPNAPNPQLNGITLDIPSGIFVGVVGQSGAGKSTLTKLIPRLYAPESGRILIDGYDIHKVELHSLRQQIGMVLQDTLLFNTTVQENIALTNPDATPEEIVQAAQVAYAHEFIMELPQGYNSQVGERGSALSGGQKQRIAIARTVLQNPNLLILDEATSALDLHTERQVCQNLMEAFKGKTVFFITHRLQTISNADVILMMSQGRIAEQGTHAELMAMRGLYYALYRQQEAAAE
jgi:ATP-binding cassette, subfamily B, bacterial HlyB/CyaB